jgi:putative flavoprotein involved in K+ transport
VPGLYYIGRSWQSRRGSALLHGVGDDTAYLVERIAEQINMRPVAQSFQPQRAGV